MKKIYMSCLVAGFLVMSSCKKFLDVNTNTNAPSTVTANALLAPMLHWMVTDAAYEGRFIGRYTQNWALPGGTALSTWDRMGYDPGSDNGAQTYRDVYWALGINLNEMISKAETEQRWDVLGVGYILKAWGWQTLSGIHGEITIKEAFMPNKTTFAYDTQEFAYEESRRLLNLAIASLQRTDGFVSSTYLAKGDVIYGGDRSKWIKYAYGLLAINLNHYSNKLTYNPDLVIDAVNKSFTSNADNAMLTYTNTGNDDSNFMGPRRQNFQNYRQTEFIVKLMDGTQFGVNDPRKERMLAKNPSGGYTGVNVNSLYSAAALEAGTYPHNIWNYKANIAGGTRTLYLFDDKSTFPAMTYSQLQFIKAEAAYKKGEMITAHTAYVNGISAHIDFVNERNTDNRQNATQILASEKAVFLASPTVVPVLAANLTLSQIMSQKYIAQWGWGHFETWMDLRRYHYTDLDPVKTTQQVFLGFALPTSLYADNNNLSVQRIRPRYNSEYVWNRAELDKVGGLATDYHTVPLWITKP